MSTSANPARGVVQRRNSGGRTGDDDDDSDDLAPRTSFDSIAETAGPDLVVELLGQERQRRREERFGPAVRFVSDDWDEFLPNFVTQDKESRERQLKLLDESSQKLKKPQTWLVTVASNGAIHMDDTGKLDDNGNPARKLYTLFLHEPQQKGGTDRFLLLEPHGLPGHNQLAPEIGRDKQWRLPERDIRRVVSKPRAT